MARSSQVEFDTTWPLKHSHDIQCQTAT